MTYDIILVFGRSSPNPFALLLSLDITVSEVCKYFDNMFTYVNVIEHCSSFAYSSPYAVWRRMLT